MDATTHTTGEQGMTPQIMKLLFELIEIRTSPVQTESVVKEAYRIEAKIMKLLKQSIKDTK